MSKLLIVESPTKVKSIKKYLGGEYNVPHGLANAILLPHVLEAYGSGIHKKYSRIRSFR